MNRLCLAVLVATLFLLTSAVHALEIKAFSESEFKSLKDASKPVIVWLHASWCSTCKRQEKSLSELAKDPSFDIVTILKADYDNSDDLQRTLKANRQSTFIVFKGSTEVGRTVGVTRESDLTELFKKSL